MQLQKAYLALLAYAAMTTGCALDATDAGTDGPVAKGLNENYDVIEEPVYGDLHHDGFDQDGGVELVEEPAYNPLSEGIDGEAETSSDHDRYVIDPTVPFQIVIPGPCDYCDRLIPGSFQAMFETLGIDATQTDVAYITLIMQDGTEYHYKVLIKNGRPWFARRIPTPGPQPSGPPGGGGGRGSGGATGGYGAGGYGGGLWYVSRAPRGCIAVKGRAVCYGKKRR